MKYLAQRNRLRALEAQLAPKGTRIVITGGLPDDYAPAKPTPGPMSEVMAYLPQTTAREQAELERARVTADRIKRIQSATRAVQVAAFADAIDHLERRLDAKEAELEEQALRDAEEAEHKEAGAYRGAS